MWLLYKEILITEWIPIFDLKKNNLLLKYKIAAAKKFGSEILQVLEQTCKNSDCETYINLLYTKEI